MKISICGLLLLSIWFGFTVWINSLTMCLGALNLLHHYKSNYAHLLSFGNLVIEFFNAKR